MSKRLPPVSVAKKYEEVIDILKNVPNKSEYICQAVIEKYNFSKNNKSNRIDNETLKNEIKQILSEMINDNIFLVKGNISNLVTVKGVIGTESEDNITVIQSKKKNNIPFLSEDTEDLLKRISADW